MNITCVSDFHGYYPDLPGGDLLIVAGDLTARDEPEQYIEFQDWFEKQEYKKRIIIAGNHDNYLVKYGPNMFLGCEYLCDSGTEFEGLKIWGTPWTRRFYGQNPDCMAFSYRTEYELKEKFDLIPNDIDILISHTPPFGILDECDNGRVGSWSLKEAVFRVKPKLLVFGHIHECGGKIIDLTTTIFVNASCVDEHYRPVNKPVQITF